jgi:hypothetical protein
MAIETTTATILKATKGIQVINVNQYQHVSINAKSHITIISERFLVYFS